MHCDLILLHKRAPPTRRSLPNRRLADYNQQQWAGLVTAIAIIADIVIQVSLQSHEHGEAYNVDFKFVERYLSVSTVFRYDPVYNS